MNGINCKKKVHLKVQTLILSKVCDPAKFVFPYIYLFIYHTLGMAVEEITEFAARRGASRDGF
jgi:hypothetical protein